MLITTALLLLSFGDKIEEHDAKTDLVLRSLSRGGKTTQTISRLTKVKGRTLEEILDALIAEGKVTVSGRGKNARFSATEGVTTNEENNSEPVVRGRRTR